MIGRLEVLLHRGDRDDPAVRVLQMQAGFRRLNDPRLHQQNAGDDLEAVGDAVAHLRKQRVSLREELLPGDALLVAHSPRA